MKKDIKHKIILLILAGLGIVACCKKEKCPKLTEELKNILPHYTGEYLEFQCRNLSTNKIDTISAKINKFEVNENIPCYFISSKEHTENAGKCIRYIAYNFLFDVNLLNTNNQFGSVLRFTEKLGSFQSNFKYSTNLQQPFYLNERPYNEVIVDSIETPNDLDDPRETVLYYTKKDGLIMARSYLYDTLEFELIKIY